MLFKGGACHCAGGLSFSDSTNLSLLTTVLVLVSGMAGLEWGMARISHSAALLADSGHLLMDGLAIAIALLAAWMAGRARQSSQSHRLETLAGFINGVGVLVMAVLIGSEAVRHLQAPPSEILSWPMLVTALVGLGVNGFNAWLLQRSNGQQNLNLRGVFVHVLADALSSMGVIVAAIAIGLLHWTWIDGAISLALAGLIGWSALPLIRQSWRQMRTPEDYSLAQVGFCELGKTQLEDLIDRNSW